MQLKVDSYVDLTVFLVKPGIYINMKINSLDLWLKMPISFTFRGIGIVLVFCKESFLTSHTKSTRKTLYSMSRYIKLLESIRNNKVVE